MSFTVDLLTGLAQHLADADIGITYRPSDPYLPAETGVFFKALPTGPDRCVVITAYATSDEAKVALSHVRVQFWFRGVANDTLDVDNLGDDAFAVLQGAEDLTFGAAHLVQALRVSSIQLGVDDNKRSQRSDNYELDLDVPLTPGRPW